MKRNIWILIYILFCPISATIAQQSGTNEEQLQKDTSSYLSNTTIGGYGDIVYQRNFNEKFSTINLERFVLFTGHKFTRKISFFSELEVEDAKVSGGEAGGEIALEQCYLKFNINPNNYIVGGLFLPRMGILNETHLPNTFNGNERTQVETYILPSTWRELGIGYYGNSNRIPLSYSIALVNGLNSASFEHGSVIREGRFEGRNASANNLAVTGSVQFYSGNLRTQIAGYYGGSVGLSPSEADSLKLTSGMFGTPVAIGEADLQYEAKGFAVRILGSVISIPDASDINRAYASNTPKTAYGAYAEIAYNILESMNSAKGKQMILFVRYEKLDMNASIPANGIIDGTLNQQHIITGITYLPIKNVAIKMDVRFLHTGKQNPSLSNPLAPAYKENNTFLNLGLGFSF
ncbi:MAG TPA: hypothetical protein VIH57_17305 [Bacteroidales bacterium]